MTQVGYNTIGGGTLDLASIQQNQQKINLAKQKNQQDIVNNILTIFQKQKEDEMMSEQFKQKIATELYTKLLPSTYSYPDPTAPGGMKTVTMSSNSPEMQQQLSKVINQILGGGSMGGKGGIPEIGSPVSPQAMSAQPMAGTQPTQPNIADYQNIAKGRGMDVNIAGGMAPDKQAQVLNQLFQAKGLTPPTTEQSNPLPPDISGIESIGGKVKFIKKSGGGYGAAQLNYAKENASILADAVQKNDYGAIAGLSKTAMTPIAVELRKRGINVSEPMLAFKGQQAAAGNAKIQDQKVASAISAQTLLNSSYDPKTGEYKVPPSMHVELALSVARLLSQTGVVPYDMVQELRQKTLREGLAGAAIWIGFDPKEVGGSTQDVIKLFAKTINREGLTSEKMRNKYMQGGVSSFSEFAKTSAEENKKIGQNIQTFNINGKSYNIPLDKVDEFKKDMGL